MLSPPVFQGINSAGSTGTSTVQARATSGGAWVLGRLGDSGGAWNAEGSTGTSTVQARATIGGGGSGGPLATGGGTDEQGRSGARPPRPDEPGAKPDDGPDEHTIQQNQHLAQTLRVS
jgi:hypothetical protein